VVWCASGVARASRPVRRLSRRVSYRFWDAVAGTGIERVNARLLRTTVGVADVLRDFGAVVPDRAVVHGPLVVHNAVRDYGNLTIGPNAHVGRLVTLDLTAPLAIEENTVVSMGTTILTHEDVGDRPLGERYPRRVVPTTIGADSYVGANATILCGCDIGRGAVVAAGSVVTRPVADGSVVGGAPAKPLRETRCEVDPPNG
jgi:acetyltransferase-like isoleucine patch superfamily enzyme